MMQSKITQKVKSPLPLTDQYAFRNLFFIIDRPFTSTYSLAQVSISKFSSLHDLLARLFVQLRFFVIAVVLPTFFMGFFHFVSVSDDVVDQHQKSRAKMNNLQYETISQIYFLNFFLHEIIQYPICVYIQNTTDFLCLVNTS